MFETNPLVSVIVTSYNQIKTISQTLDSILAQNFDHSFEIIIGDDHSCDDSIKICNKYQRDFPDIIVTSYNDENIGIAANFAKCVKKARGKYIAICAADDYWHNPTKLKIQVNYFENRPEVGLIYTDYDKLNINTGKIHKNYLST